MKKLLSIVIFALSLSLATQINGQEIDQINGQGHVVGQFSNHKKPHFIEFEIAEEVSYRELSYKIDQVIDNTNSGGIYGHIIKGFNNTKRAVKFTGGLESQIQKFINNYSFYNPYGKSLVMKIDKLRFSKAADFNAKKDPGIILITIRYYHEGELFFQESITKTHKKTSHQNRIYAKFLQSALEQSLENLEKYVLEY